MAATVPHLDAANASFVTDRLAVGGDLPFAPTAAVLHAMDLVRAGVTHVLDVRLEIDDSALWSCFPEVSYLWDGIDDAGQQIPGEWFERTVCWCLEALEDPVAKVLTHCHMGINRGPSTGYAVLLALGWDPVEAIDAIRGARPIANVWYAESALRWHHDRVGASRAERREDRRRLREWRDQHPLDVVRLIAVQRAAGM